MELSLPILYLKMKWSIYNSTLVTSENITFDFEFGISENHFSFNLNNVDFSINLHGRVVLPAFINSFDNLLATYLPYKGGKKVYYNWLEWDNELKTSELFKERMLLDREELYFLGAYKNVFSGVDFVVDHIPKFVFEDLISFLDVDLLMEFGIAHSPVTYSLNWGKGIKFEFNYAKTNHLPFIIRVGEGYDRESKHSIKKLYEMGALSENTVLICGVSMDEEDINLIKSQNSKIVWCPEINEILFGKTIPIRNILANDITVCLGSGSTMQGSKNLLSTIQTSFKYISDGKIILQMILDNPRNAFNLKKKGNIKDSYWADFIVLNEISPKNYDFIKTLDNQEIILLVHKGYPLYGSEQFLELFKILQIECEKIIVAKKERYVKKGFTNKMKEIFLKLGKEIEFPFFK